jgi:perosamine synthetase
LEFRWPIAKPEIGKEELTNVTKAVESGWVSSRGPFIPQFEGGFSEFVGVRHGVSTSNGTTALHLALLSLGVGPGDEVIVPTLTFVASANVVRYCGATPVFVDSAPDYWCANPKSVLRRITRKTKAIMPVHLYGHPCDMDPLMEAARGRGIAVVEDCAEAHGALYRGRKVGSFGDVSCFSFYGNKIITTGEGGMCLTNDRSLAEKMRVLRDHGSSGRKKYWHEVVGYNYRMTNLNAALGVAQLQKIGRLVDRKRRVASLYREALGSSPLVATAPEMPWARSVFWLYSVLVKRKRDRVIERLAAEGVESRPVFYPVHRLPPYRGRRSYPVAERLSRTGLSLPSGPVIEDSDVFAVSSRLLAALRG